MHVLHTNNKFKFYTLKHFKITVKCCGFRSGDVLERSQFDQSTILII